MFTNINHTCKKAINESVESPQYAQNTTNIKLIKSLPESHRINTTEHIKMIKHRQKILIVNEEIQIKTTSEGYFNISKEIT